MSNLGKCPTVVNVQLGKISHMVESPTGCCYLRVAVPRIVVSGSCSRAIVFTLQCDGMMFGMRFVMLPSCVGVGGRGLI